MPLLGTTQLLHTEKIELLPKLVACDEEHRKATGKLPFKQHGSDAPIYVL